MHPFINTAIKAARKAGDIMLQSIDRLDTINPTAKGHRDFVTDIDKRAEKEIISTLKKAYPDHAIIGEESGQHPGDADSVWIIDPLDGTHNYLRGFPHFSVSIGFKSRGKLEHGVVYDPIRQEVFSASRGEGARLNDRRIRVSSTLRLDNALIGTGFPVRHPKDLPNYLDHFIQLLPHIANIRCSGSAALDLCYVAVGRLDAFLEIGLGPWDMAAGAVIAKEAGALVSDWQGEEKHLEKGSIVAATPKIFKLLLQHIEASISNSR
jgi:myo-inositol-1(or 4)-monophosphatase